MTTSSMALQGASSSLRSSSSSIHPWTHDVFLSFRGKDVRQKFISHLYHALNKRGINTYIDDELERGEEISQALFQAIEGSMISIIVLSKNYADSRWCLNELLKILECMGTVKQNVLPVFYEVDPSDVRHQKGSFGEAFAKLKDKFEGNEEVLKWEAALEKLANMSGVELKNYRKESEFIEEIIQWAELRVVNQPLSVAKYPIGIEYRKRDIYKHLSIERNDIIRIVGIFGTGGIGKTTISKDIYNQFYSQFEGSCFLKNVRETSKPAGGLIQLQNTILFEILGTKLDVPNTDKGINVIKNKLSSKRILLILDDVDELVQLENLAGDRAWFGLGSRIIITTRDQRLLDNAKVDSKHEVMILDDSEALQLFSLHAVGKDEPSDEYVDLAKQVIQYAKGLPLALAVLGSDLKGKSAYQWKSALDKYKNIPNRDIQKVLLVSYEGLDNNEKEIFLDIACFFKGEPLLNIMKIFDNCGFSPDDGIDRLKDKCLITIEGGYVRMHDLLQDMGQEIVRLESPNEPGQRSRLFFHEDVRHVLEESMGTNKVGGMMIQMPKGEEVIRLNSEAFVQMKRLRVLINRNASFSSGPNYLSNELRVLDWFGYPLQSLPPNFHGNKLIIFKMCGSFIRELNFIKFKNMTIMDFSDCKFLTKVPDLSSIPNLKELIARWCRSLVEVHNSVGSLAYLCRLNFHGCTNLENFPTSLKLRSLQFLQLCFCSSLRSFPKIECEMKFLTRLDLSFTTVEELPLSIGNLARLDSLLLDGCKNLKRLPINFILRLPHLTGLGIFAGCTNLVKKMGYDGSTTMEDEISSNEEQLQELAPPTNSSNESSALQVLNHQNCFQSESNFFPISSLFTMFDSSTTLTYLDLSGSEFVSLPTIIKGFVALVRLCLMHCEKLEEILELPPNIVLVEVLGCKSLERFPEVSRIMEFNGSHIRSLKRIDLDGCDKMHEKIWIYKVPNPLLWKAGHYRTNEDREEEEWVINIEGPNHLEDISGIVVYASISYTGHIDCSVYDSAMVTIKTSNCVWRFKTNEAVRLSNTDKTNEFNNEVMVLYSDLESFEPKVLDDLVVQLDIPTFFSGLYYGSLGANIVYMHESRAHKRRKMD
ncbi:hypothetical protein I3843_15G099300 [Carya illinoinensis]|uniref:disease resistance protein RPV1-like isoform X1 n=1 Tax=Carya illinoinensis TaxID=32201 RepID=UPI001C71BDBE|nr:disease resistance protein RPV1-like isoform X1 [Carya illinoinensis]XP_042961248.1 disease resistance protein RPV1-like isoform X1 [Carya illinoinensis]XP_042961249.1 disease resistance protein RPV1-like isoform X1 [Carya illinoinensis]XP_042961250.1 disease resistance protein RPV1-like isoform X1 [Carya illinoinensis]XP_042961252.1 disease resistance protein RPV1-like isoform X1 [Carya illinoinensis]XP_042961253.1 disease resistance protein RPV1-like isoform X1 [Carya illinoinensis]XP_04